MVWLPGDILVRPIFVLLWWSESWTWIATFFILPSLVVLYFPDGRLLSRRWWPVLVASVIGIVGYMVHDSFQPSSSFVGVGEVRALANPFVINASERFFTGLLDVASAFLAIGIIGSLLAMAIRFRRSQGIERTQMKWMVYVVGVCMSVVLLLSLFLDGDDPILGTIFLSLPILIALTIGIAILRHGLFDIDIVIRRTVQYSIVSVILLAVYFGSITVIQQLVTSVTQNESPIAIVISTLLIAALFNPLRQRVQAFVDRRFFRKKYDPQQVLAQFTEAARDETDIEVLKTELEQIVQNTLQPERVSIWLKQK
jgi:hypothetical protein